MSRTFPERRNSSARQVNDQLRDRHGPSRSGDMDIYFNDERLKKLCSSRVALVARYGAAGGAVVVRRLGQLAAAPTLEDIRRLGRLGNAAGSLCLPLHAGYRLIFTPWGRREANESAARFVWSAIETVTVIEIDPQ
jgi:hypothetical protein